MEALQPGDPRRVGSYRLFARLGSGGMGVVYLGRSPGGRAVAVKVVRDRFAADATFRARFRREVAAARSVTGVSTAVVLDADAEADRPWLVTAYVPGVTLRQAVRTVGPLPPPTLRVLAAAVAEALVDIHRAGLVHRDLKPANVMVTADGIRVIDFGIARPTDATAITQVGTVIGTPGFMSPEQVSGADVGRPSDIFSLGSLLMYAATGREPFASDAVAVTLHRVRTVDADLDGLADLWLRGLVAACLRADPARRPTAADLLDRVAAAAAQTDTDWLPPALAEEIDRRAAEVTEPPDDAPVEGSGHLDDPTIEPSALPRPLPRRLLLAGGAAALLAAGGVAALLRGGKDPVTAPPTPTPSVGSPTPTAPPEAGERWRAKVSDYFPEELFAVAGLVLARTSEDELVALDAATGARRWTLPASSLGTVSGGVVFQALDINPELALVDPATGAARWKTRRQFPGDHWSRLVVSGPLVAWGAKEVRAQELSDGRTRWVAPVPSEAGLVAVADLLIAAGDPGLAALDLSSGQVRWRHAVDHPWFLAAGADMVFFVDPQSGLHGLRAADGVAVWSKPDFGMSTWPSVVGPTLYASRASGHVFAITPATGDTLWARPFKAATRAEVSGGTMCVATSTRTTYGLNAADGTVLWTYRGDVGGPPAMTNCSMAGLDGQFYLGVREGFVVALAPPGDHRAGS